MKINEKLVALRKEMSRHNIDVYIVPTCDFHGSEYIGDYFKTREYISGFTGSAGTAVVTMDEALLWTDGRYFIQAESQIKDSEFKLMKSGQPGVPTIKEFLKKNMKNGQRIGFDGRTIIASEAEEYSSINNIKIHSNIDLVGEIWKERPELSCNKIWELDLEYAGLSREKKISKIRKAMKGKVDILILTALDEIAWTLNLRGDDVECTPVFLAFMAISKDETILFIQNKALNVEEEGILKGIEVKDYFEIYDYIGKLENKKIWISKENSNYNIVSSISKSNVIVDEFTPPYMMKAIKNATEVKNIEKAHLLDGIAMTKFIYWLKSNVGNVAMTETSLGNKLEEFRGEAESYIGPSFTPIVGYNDHGAIVHYNAVSGMDYEIKPEGIVLVDSGGQYLEGTTDITRTISLGTVTDKMKKMYTAVLRGHLKLSSAVFKEGCTGVSLDYLARKPLWDMSMDYNHGTGHGVGYLLNVHEGPNAFRYKILEKSELNAVIKSGMVTSVEPGVYIENEFGIRIENLVVCKKKKESQYGKFLELKNLTLVPYDMELVDTEIMSEEEMRLLKKYHKMVYRKISPYLTEEESKWLKRVIGSN